jgi:hypothetical protein
VKTLEAKEAARSFTRILKQVHSLHECFAIVKEGVPWAYLAPPVARACSSHELAADLAGAELTANDRRAFAAAIRKGRRGLKPVRNPWG